MPLFSAYQVNTCFSLIDVFLMQHQLNEKVYTQRLYTTHVQNYVRKLNVVATLSGFQLLPNSVNLLLVGLEDCSSKGGVFRNQTLNRCRIIILYSTMSPIHRQAGTTPIKSELLGFQSARSNCKFSLFNMRKLLVVLSRFY